MAAIQRMIWWTTKESITPASLNTQFGNVFSILNNINSGLLPVNPNGFIVTTPNGLHTYLIGVDNDGALTSTQIT